MTHESRLSISHRALAIVLLVIIAAGVTACSTVTADAPKTREAREWDIREAVFRYQFEHNASGSQRGVDYYFIAVDESTDPPPEFVGRFAGHKPSVLPVSAATAPTPSGVSHKELGGTGLIFRVSTIRWIGDTVVEVEGSYFEGGVSASGNTYRVELRGDTWVVTSNNMNWIAWATTIAGRDGFT